MAHLKKGAYDLLIDQVLQDLLKELPDTLRPDRESISSPDLASYISREVSRLVTVRLSALAKEEEQDRNRQGQTLSAANRIFEVLDENRRFRQEVLSGVWDRVTTKDYRPAIPLASSALITNDQKVNYHTVLRSELQSADRVDLICPFIGNQGLNLIFESLANLQDRLRVITTTYLGGTHVGALKRLANAGAQIKIVYEGDDQKTSLHAKAWVFHRASGFSTATLGSSNISPRALVDGLEWNVKLSAHEARHLLEELIVTFERLWANPIYETFDADRDIERVARSIRENRGESQEQVFFVDVAPRPHQQEALDSLALARLEGRTKNLVVAATGTGKTLLAAFDYARISDESKQVKPSLLFVAHRGDILSQSRRAFQMVLRDSDFGELHVGQDRAQEWKHVFASVQSLAHADLNTYDPDRFDYIVIDEFHHAEAPTYERLLHYFRPKQLIGLTATPERADGKRTVTDSLWPPTYELRLWHALERQLLAPFHYFGIDDGTDLSHVNWVKGNYETKDLEEEFVGRGIERSQLIIRELDSRADRQGLIAVAFCVSIRHAEFMAERFMEAGFSAEAVHSGMDSGKKDQSVKDFRAGKLQILCTVDLFNEGVDIPNINTVLFLRPTESATIFIQQLGRGLRNAPNKGALTVLDFVGQQNKKFRLDLRFRAMTGLSPKGLSKAVESDFPALPPGCDIRLDRVVKERVIKGLKSAIPSTMAQLTAELRNLSQDGRRPSLSEFLDQVGITPDDLYRSGRSYASVCASVGIWPWPVPESQGRVGAYCHADDRRRLQGYLDSLNGTASEPFQRMLSLPLLKETDLESLHPSIRQELLELLEHLSLNAHMLPQVADDLPFSLHAHYSRDEIVSPFRENPSSMREGTFFIKDLGVDVHLLTLSKSEKHFSPSTRYQDYFVSPSIVHWESQSTTSLSSPTGQRFIRNRSRNLVFVRIHKDDRFQCLGLAKCVKYESEKPISILWELEHAVPDHKFIQYRSAAG